MFGMLHSTFEVTIAAVSYRLKPQTVYETQGIIYPVSYFKQNAMQNDQTCTYIAVSVHRTHSILKTKQSIATSNTAKTNYQH